MRLERQASCIDMGYLPDCDDYDPRKPEFVKAATDSEVAQVELGRLAHQVQSLERTIARRDKLASLSWFFSRKRAHYNQVVGEMRMELQRHQSVLPAPTGKVERCWNSIMKTRLRTVGLCLPGSDLVSICELLRVSCYAFELPCCHVRDFDVRTFLAISSEGLLLSSVNFALLLLPRIICYSCQFWVSTSLALRV